MIKSIYDMDIDEYTVKEGDVKVNASELKRLFQFIADYHTILHTLLDELSEDNKNTLYDCMEFIEYIQNKYIVLGDCRRKQKQWYDILKKLDDKEFTKKATPEEVEKVRREVWGYYLESKTERENLQAEVDKIKEKKYWYLK